MFRNALHKRISEHCSKSSDLYKAHLSLCDTALLKSDFTVIEYCRSNPERLIKEAFYIEKLAPVLNTKMPANGRSIFLRL